MVRRNLRASCIERPQRCAPNLSLPNAVLQTSVYRRYGYKVKCNSETANAATRIRADSVNVNHVNYLQMRARER